MNLSEDFAKAIENRDSNTIASLIVNCLVDVNARLPRKSNPPALVFGVNVKSVEIVAMLLNAGAHINGVDDVGCSACHVAVLSRHHDMLALLLKHAPDLGLRTRAQTPLYYSLLIDDDDGRMSTMLIDAGAPFDGRIDFFQLLQRNLTAQGTPIFRSLLNRGFDISELRDRDRNSLLHAAAERSRDPYVWNMLVSECGIDFEARNKYNSTCCHVAAVRSNVVALRCLVEAGADVNSRRSEAGSTPLRYVRDIECALILLAGGADVNIGFQQLGWMCNAFRPMLFVVLAAGADLDTKNRDGCTLREHLVEYYFDFDFDFDWGKVEKSRRDIAEVRLDFVRHRAFQVCIGLQPLGLDALQMCEILVNACGPVAPLIEFHQWWKIATTVKHFLD
jgi:ankyrin repeat protein